MKILAALISLSFLSIPARVLAASDQIILHEGKTLTGTIMSEDDREFTINIGQNMILRVEKSKVKSVRRAERKPRREIWTPSGVSKSTMPAAGEPARAEPVKKAPEPPAVLNLKPGVRADSRMIERAQIQEALIYRTFAAQGSTLSASSSTWITSYAGVPESEGGRTRWKSLVVKATMTLTFPIWVAPSKPPEKAVQDWNAFIKGLEFHELGHVEIYENSLDDFGRAVSSLSSASDAALKQDTDLLFRRMLQDTEKKQRGYERRMSRKK